MSSPVRVSSLGRFARAALASGEARVIAVFERSAYVETPAGLACLGAVGNGPLNARCAAAISDIAVGDLIATDIDGATTWRPASAPKWNASTVRASLLRLRADARPRLPSEGFGFVIDSARPRPHAIEALQRWLADPAGDLDGARGLIGLGPGLTPSGDDLIGGAICALHAARRTKQAKRLATWALSLARESTNRISNAHLACAAEGECSEVINGAIVALLAGEVPDLKSVDAIGHTSGWDALAGVTLALGYARISS